MFRHAQTNLYVADVERALAFYAAIGGVESFRTPAHGAPVHVEVTLGGHTVGLASVDAARAHGLDVSSDGNAVELTLWSDDLLSDWARVLAAGGTVMAEPTTGANGLMVAWAADPDGNPVHLVMRLVPRAVAVVRRGDDVLVVRRHRTGADPEDYTVLPGGGVEDGESDEQAAVRELAEEATMTARVERLLLEGHHGPRPARYFLMTDVVGEPVLGGEEAEAHSPENSFVLVWVPIDELATEPFFPVGLGAEIAGLLR